MGLLDFLKPNRRQVETTRTALDEARDPSPDNAGAIAGLVQNLLDLGIDGRGPAKSAQQVAEAALRSTGGDVEAAIAKVVRPHLSGAAAGGFLTSLGGFVTMPVAIPVNVLEFYLQATRMVAAVAHLRGYDLSDPEIRSAVLLTLAGQNADDILAKIGVSTVAGGTVTTLLRSRLPKSALMMLNKAIGFRLLKSVGEKTLAKLGRAIPVAGGVIGAGLDLYLMKRIAQAARREFAPTNPTL